MEAYATAVTAPIAQLRVLERPVSPTAAPSATGENLILNELLGQLADLVAERVAARLREPQRGPADGWLDTRHAAEYLGIGRDSVRRLAAEGSLPTEQAGVGCKLFFRSSVLDKWRCSGSGPIEAPRSRRHG